MLDFEVQRCTRKCCETDAILQPGDEFYSALVAQGSQVSPQGLQRRSVDGTAGRIARLVEVAGARHALAQNALGAERRASCTILNNWRKRDRTRTCGTCWPC